MIVDALDLGFVNDDANFDNSVPWAAWVNDNSKPHWVAFDGPFYFKQPPAVATRPISIEMPGTNMGGFFRDYEPASPYEPFLHFKATANFRNVVVEALQGIGGYGMVFEGTPAGDSNIDGGYISVLNGAMWGTPLVLNGLDMPLGIRSFNAVRCEIFSATQALVHMINVKGCDFYDVNCYPTGGGVNHVTIQHNVAADGTILRSQSISWRSRFLTMAYLYNSDNVIFECNLPVTLSLQNCTNVKNK